MLSASSINRRGLISLLVLIQNSPENLNRDIVTFAGLCDDTELADHVIACFRSVPVARRLVVLDAARALANVEG